MVLVRLEKGLRSQYNMWHPVWVEGRFHLNSVQSAYGSVAFEMDGLTIEAFDEN
jgi:hypothetical protein